MQLRADDPPRAHVRAHAPAFAHARMRAHASCTRPDVAELLKRLLQNSHARQSIARRPPEP
eukprot:6179106-Pleurochrysis_carterae.AAC.1